MGNKLQNLKDKLRTFWYLTSSNRKIVGSFLGVLVLTVSLGVGLYLVRSRQNTKVGASGAELTLTASNASPKVGDSFVVSIYLDTKGLPVTGADLKISYNASLLDATSVTPGTYLPTVFVPGQVSAGSTAITLVSLPTAPKSGTGILATINFKGKAPGTADISFAGDTALSALGQHATNVAGVFKSVQVTMTGTPLPSPSPTTTPSATPGSQNGAIITNAGIATNYTPWAVYAQGTGLTSTQKLRVIDTTGVQWGGDLTTYYSPGIESAFLPSNSPPSKCNAGKTCTIGVYVVASNGMLSNRFDATLPSYGTPLPSPTGSQGAAVITNAGVVTSYNPWAVWVIGTSFTAGQKARLIDTDGKTWGSDIATSNPVAYQTTQQAVSFSLPSNSPPSGCNIGKTCTIGLYLVTSGGGLSNKYNLTLPAK